MTQTDTKVHSVSGVANADELQTRLDEHDKLNCLFRERLDALEGIENDMAALSWELDGLQETQKDIEARYSKADKRHNILVGDRYHSSVPEARRGFFPDLDQLSIAFCGIDARIADARSAVQLLEIDLTEICELVEQAERRLRAMSDMHESVVEELEEMKQDIADAEAEVQKGL